MATKNSAFEQDFERVLSLSDYHDFVYQLSHAVKAAPGRIFLSRLLTQLIKKYSDNRKMLMKLASVNFLPWDTTHGRDLMQTSLAEYVIDKLYIPMDNETVNAALNNRKHGIDLKAVQRIKNPTPAQLLIFNDGYRFLAPLSVYHQGLLDRDKLNMYLTTNNEVGLDEILVILQNLPEHCLTNESVMSIYSRFKNVERLDMAMAGCMPFSISRNVFYGVVLKFSEDAKAVVGYHQNLTVDQIRTLVKSSDLVRLSLASNRYIEWTPDLVDHFMGHCSDAMRERHMANFGTMGFSVKVKCSTKAEEEDAVGKPGISIVRGVAVNKDDGQWNKLAATAVSRKYQAEGEMSVEMDGLNASSVKDRVTRLQEKMNDDYPNFADVTELLAGQLFSCLIRKVPIHFQSMLLLGDVGIGKTSYLHTWSEQLAIACKRVDMATVTAGFILTGSSSVWRGGQPGAIAKMFLKDAPLVANPIFILDEIDKVGDEYQHPIVESLLAVLEKRTAKKFQDEHLEGFSFDLTHASFFMTANSVHGMPDYLLSRLLVIDVPAPTTVQKHKILHQIYLGKLKEMGMENQYAGTVPTALVDTLSIKSLRDIDRDVALAITRAMLRADIGNGVITLQSDDFHEASPRTSMGFVKG